MDPQPERASTKLAVQGYVAHPGLGEPFGT